TTATSVPPSSTGRHRTPPAAKMLAFTCLSGESVNGSSTSGCAAAHEFDLMISCGMPGGRGCRPGAVAFQRPASGGGVQSRIEDALQMFGQLGILHLNHDFDSAIEVAVHHVRAADPVLVRTPEMEQARMFQEPAEDRPNPDVFAQAG